MDVYLYQMDYRAKKANRIQSTKDKKQKCALNHCGPPEGKKTKKRRTQDCSLNFNLHSENDDVDTSWAKPAEAAPHIPEISFSRTFVFFCVKEKKEKRKPETENFGGKAFKRTPKNEPHLECGALSGVVAQPSVVCAQ